MHDNDSDITITTDRDTWDRVNTRIIWGAGIIVPLILALVCGL